MGCNDADTPGGKTPRWQSGCTRQTGGTPDSEVNQSHQIIIVAAELDPSTERIVDYLSKNGISINVLFFKVFQHGDEQFLSRAWLIDPSETQTNAAQATATSASAKELGTASFTSHLATRTVATGKKHVVTGLSARGAEVGTARR